MRHEMGIKQQGRGMGLQAAALASQINLNDSQAEKNRAEELIEANAVFSILILQILH